MRKKNIVAICYDFDGTLAPGNMQEHSLLPALKLKPSEFWKEVKDFAKENNMNEVLAYMCLILKKAKEAGHPIKRNEFKKHGKEIKLFRGVEKFFDKINEYGSSKKITIEHYIISSGLKEIIEGTKIKKHFKYIFASEFHYDENGVAVWPSVAIDYTNKTQYLFRINKNIMNIWDNSQINKYIEEEKRRIPFRKIIYIGDGETDIPSMKMVNHQGGYSIAVYDESKRSSKNKKSPRDVCLELIEHRRAKFIAPANYNTNSKLFKLLKLIIDKISIDDDLMSKQP